MNKNKFQKGFTLIELLVVIAIIGILASVLLVNLSGTRNKAKDSAIKLEMNQIRTAMESWSSSQTPNTYVGGEASADVTALKTAITGNGAGTVVQFEQADKWCVQYPLNTGGGTWCVDSTGYSGASSIACDTTNKDCATP